VLAQSVELNLRPVVLHRAQFARTQIDRSVMQTVCAFANEPGLGGGHLLLGVERDGQDLFDNTYRVVGVAQPDKLQADLASQCASVFKRPVRPRVSGPACCCSARPWR